MSKSQENKIMNATSVMDGFFLFFGFGENPAEQELNEITKYSPGEKIRLDVNKINTDLKDAFSEIKSGVLISND